ncbi:MAG: undecaprenyl-diphosphate phosphatase [Pseudomonadota bacterium]
MEFMSMVILALVQGLTEFLPISSSAHLILAPRLFGFPDQGLAFDVAVHLGSLLAVMLYFRRRLAVVIADTLAHWSRRREATVNARLGEAIIIATLPVVVGGLLLKELVETDFRSPLVIAATTIGFGLVLLAADRLSRHRKDLDELTLKDAWIIGLAQVLALVPGTSRSGITMTAGLFLGFHRRDAAAFSFLLAIPTILMSGVLVSFDLLHQPNPVDWQSLFTGGVLSFLAAYLCIHYFLAFIERIGMLPFVIYRLLLGLVILVLVL